MGVLSLVLPTFNEAENLERMVPLLEEILREIPHEIIVVDDHSPDRTWEIAERLGKQYPSVRVVRRIDRRGLSSAVVEGFHRAEGEVLGVMDCDGQHDPRLLPQLLAALQAGAHLAVASRYISGGSTEGWSGLRLGLSRAATFLARRLPPVRVSDPMSGYFLLRRTTFRSIAGQIHPQGFKILLEILAHLPRGARTAEVPLVFATRWTGHSKLTLRIQGEFLAQVLRIAGSRIRAFLWEAQWVVLFLAFFVMLIVLLPRAWALRSLALDSSVRGTASSTLRLMTDREGWLLSDITITRVAEHFLRFLHREHQRGEDPSTCFILRFEPLILIPCKE